MKKTLLAYPDQLNLYIAGTNNQRFRPRANCWPVIVCMYTCTHMDVCVCVCLVVCMWACSHQHSFPCQMTLECILGISKLGRIEICRFSPHTKYEIWKGGFLEVFAKVAYVFQVYLLTKCISCAVLNQTGKVLHLLSEEYILSTAVQFQPFLYQEHSSGCFRCHWETM